MVETKFTPINAHEHEVVGNCQTVYWNEWPLRKIHTFELVDYFNSPIFMQGYGQYHIYYAIAKSPIPEIGVVVNDNLILYITYKAWVTALSKMPAEIKLPCLKKVAEGKNLLVKVEKLNTKAMKLHHEEPVEPTEKQREDAKKYYAIINAEHQSRRPRWIPNK